MRILFLNQFYRPDIAATAQLLADVAEELARQGHEVHVLCSRSGYNGNGQGRPAREVLGGVHVHRVLATGFGRRRGLGRLIDYLSYYVFAMARALSLPRMDVCVSLTTPPFIGLVGSALRRTRRTRLALWTMDLYPEVLAAYRVLNRGSLLYRLLARLNRSLYRQASEIVSLGEAMTRRLIEAGAAAEKIVTVHNWVPAEAVVPVAPVHSAARRRWNPPDHLTLMYSGNLGLGHELDTALRAVADLNGKIDLRVLLVGNGRMRQPMEELAAELDLDCVSFHAPRPLDLLADSLGAGDIHLVSQRPGTQGLIVPSKQYAVLAAGRPTLFIGPPDCEVAKILRDSGAGVIVPPGNVQATAEALKALAEDAELRIEMGRRGRAYYQKHFRRDRGVAAVVKTIICRHSPRPALVEK